MNKEYFIEMISTGFVDGFYNYETAETMFEFWKDVYPMETFVLKEVKKWVYSCDEIPKEIYLPEIYRKEFSVSKKEMKELSIN